MRKTVITYVVSISACVFAATGLAEQVPQGTGVEISAGKESAVYEIRNYHYDPAQLGAYKQWAINSAIPFFKEHMDVVGFWMGNEHPPKISGTRPMQLELGSANITWIIRWDNMEARTAFHKDVFGGEQWQAIWAKHPDPAGYFQSEARFTAGY
ncbi:MAG: hypothetical protein HKN19_19100 [Halioglobus sp.]|nr:hypothetical protein [Halioglobus sp.]